MTVNSYLALFTMILFVAKGEYQGNEVVNRSAGETMCSHCRNGRDGLSGLPGRDGNKGERGQDGIKGEEGNMGIAGHRGPRGPIGIKGDLGHKGDKGDMGFPGPQGMMGPPGHGADTYIRWGNSTCPLLPGTTMVYSGWAAGSPYNVKGGGANYICISKTPEYLQYNSAKNNYAVVYGAEYEGNAGDHFYTVNDEDVPCALCYVESTAFMIPGQYTCPTGWTRQYYGYLVSSHKNHHRSAYECMDISLETVSGGAADQDGALFYQVEARCGTLPCPPYDERKELTCVVCSK